METVNGLNMGMKTILSFHPNTALVVGDAVRVNETDYVHTTQIVASNFAGRVVVEASIEVEPSEADWFTIVEWSTKEAKTGSMGFTTKGKYTYVRAKVDRMEYAINPEDKLGMYYGVIDRICFK